MRLYSTKNPKHLVDLREAVLRGLPPDNGLYMPTQTGRLSPEVLADLQALDFPSLALEMARAIIGDSIPDADLEGIVRRSITFPAPLTSLSPELYILELFHGPSLAFKDFGARFMAQLMAYFTEGDEGELVILVATSGDTGGAVAAGFHRTPGIRVVILYPSGKVSPLQEKQLTTLGDNIQAIEVAGSFDDCQRLVKQAFLDPNLSENLRLSSANSINIARLIPQSFYYAEAFKQLPPDTEPATVFCVPSGNFGNLTAGLMARKAGIPIDHFIAATNTNDVVPQYLASGTFRPRSSVATISNAMDVGDPSNFARMLDLFGGEGKHGSTWNNMRQWISGYAFSDEQTRDAMRAVYHQYRYLLDPHGAVGYLAAQAYRKDHPASRVVVLETAHPAKFKQEVESTLGVPVDVPLRLQRLADRPKVAHAMDNGFPAFRKWLLEHLGS